MTEPLTIESFARGIRQGRFSAAEVVEDFLRRIADDNPRLNAFILVTADLAREQALAADRELQQGRDRGPLHGAAVSIKDLFDFAARLDARHINKRQLEGLVKAYVGDAIADDFYREVAAFLDAPDRELVLDVLHDDRFADFVADEIRRAIEADPKVASRLALWARRLVGEALSQAQRVAAEHDALTELIVRGAGDLAAVNTMFKRLTAAHAARMAAVGLNT